MPYKNKKKQLEVQNVWLIKRKEWIQSFKDVPCADCGVKYPPHVMDFDHIGDAEKIRTVSKMTSFSKARILEEVAKCEIVCANCHRERSHQRGYNYRS